MTCFTRPTRAARFRRAAAAILLGCAALGGVARGQDVPPDAPPAERPNRQQRPAGRLFDQLQAVLGELNLTQEQAEQVRAIVRTARQDAQAKMQDAANMPAGDRQFAMREMLGEVKTKIDAVLTPEQAKTFDARIAEMRQAGPPGGRGQREAAGATQPTTAPTTAPAANAAGPGQGGMMARIERALEAAEVTPEQKAQIDPILAEAREKMTKLAADARANGEVDRQALRQQTLAILQNVRTKMDGILTPDQQAKFRAAVGGGGANDGRGRRRANGDAPPAAQSPTMTGDDSPDMAGAMAGDMAGEKPAALAPGDPPAAARQPIARSQEAGQTGLSSSKAPTPTAAVNVGDPLPAFSLTRLDGRTVNNKSLAGKPAVLVFGSYTAASFRDRVPALQSLAKRLGSRVNWLIVYTREMHPSDAGEQPERNADEKIEVAKHTTFADRTAAARLAREHLAVTLDLAPDAIDDAFTNAVGGFPNVALVVDADGKVVARQTWADPHAIERAVGRTLQRK